MDDLGLRRNPSGTHFSIDQWVEIWNITDPKTGNLGFVARYRGERAGCICLGYTPDQAELRRQGREDMRRRLIEDHEACLAKLCDATDCGSTAFNLRSLAFARSLMNNCWCGTSTCPSSGLPPCHLETTFAEHWDPDEGPKFVDDNMLQMATKVDVANNSDLREAQRLGKLPPTDKAAFMLVDIKGTPLKLYTGEDSIPDVPVEKADPAVGKKAEPAAGVSEAQREATNRAADVHSLPRLSTLLVSAIDGFYKKWKKANPKRQHDFAVRLCALLGPATVGPIIAFLEESVTTKLRPFGELKEAEQAEPLGVPAIVASIRQCCTSLFSEHVRIPSNDEILALVKQLGVRRARLMADFLLRTAIYEGPVVPATEDGPQEKADAARHTA